MDWISFTLRDFYTVLICKVQIHISVAFIYIIQTDCTDKWRAGDTVRKSCLVVFANCQDLYQLMVYSYNVHKMFADGILL